jgi:hypothetical protein
MTRHKAVKEAATRFYAALNDLFEGDVAPMECLSSEHYGQVGDGFKRGPGPSDCGGNSNRGFRCLKTRWSEEFCPPLAATPNSSLVVGAVPPGAATVFLPRLYARGNRTCAAIILYVLIGRTLRIVAYHSAAAGSVVRDV